MNSFIPTFEKFLNEGEISDKIIEFAEEIIKFFDKPTTMYSKEVDDYAKQLFSAVDFNFYIQHRAYILNVIEDNTEVKIEINEDYTTDLNKVEKEFQVMQKKSKGSLMDGKDKEMWLDLGIKLKIISTTEADKILRMI